MLFCIRNSKSESAQGSSAGWYEFVDDICTVIAGFWYIFEGSFRVDVNLFTVDLDDQVPERGMQQGYSCNYRVRTERVTTRPESPITRISWVPPSFSRDHRTVTTTSSLGRTQHTRNACRPHPALTAIKKEEGVSGRVRFTAPGAVPAPLSQSRGWHTSNVVMSTSSKKTWRRLTRVFRFLLQCTSGAVTCFELLKGEVFLFGFGPSCPQGRHAQDAVTPRNFEVVRKF